MARCSLTFEYFGGKATLYLNNNKIAAIEAQAFGDLISVKELWIRENMIKTFDESLFDMKSKLETIHLEKKRIDILSWATFEFPCSKLQEIFLEGNICVDSNYATNNWTQLKQDLEANVFAK